MVIFYPVSLSKITMKKRTSEIRTNELLSLEQYLPSVLISKFRMRGESLFVSPENQGKVEILEKECIKLGINFNYLINKASSNIDFNNSWDQGGIFTEALQQAFEKRLKERPAGVLLEFKETQVFGEEGVQGITDSLVEIVSGKIRDLHEQETARDIMTDLFEEIESRDPQKAYEWLLELTTSVSNAVSQGMMAEERLFVQTRNFLGRILSPMTEEIA